LGKPLQTFNQLIPVAPNLPDLFEPPHNCVTVLSQDTLEFFVPRTFLLLLLLFQ